jgi:hypothetical protein
MSCVDGRALPPQESTVYGARVVRRFAVSRAQARRVFSHTAPVGGPPATALQRSSACGSRSLLFNEPEETPALRTTGKVRGMYVLACLVDDGHKDSVRIMAISYSQNESAELELMWGTQGG